MDTSHKNRTRLLKVAAAIAFVIGTVSINGNSVLVVSNDIIPGVVINVPEDVPTIQAAINAADNGDTVLVAPGIYYENLILDGKTITLASRFYTTNRVEFREQTIIDGQGNTIIDIGDAASETKIIGLTIQNGNDGLSVGSKIHIIENSIIGNVDGIDYEGGGGICDTNLISENRDDGIDLDGSTGVSIIRNTIHGNGDDGIETRLHPYSGETLDISIRENTISGNREDGIQLIDYPDLSSRNLRIERNVFVDNAMAAIGFMADGNTREDLDGASVPERVYIVNNTFVDETYGIVGGANVVALNNIFTGIHNSALRRVTLDSIASYNLFWNNGIHYEDSNVDLANTLFHDPLLGSNYSLTEQSAAIDKGTATFTWQGETVLDLPGTSYTGSAPDIGAFETGWKFAVYGNSNSEYGARETNIDGIVSTIPNDMRITVLNTGDMTPGGLEPEWLVWREAITTLNIDWTRNDPPGYIGAVGDQDTAADGWLDRWSRYLPSQAGSTAYPRS